MQQVDDPEQATKATKVFYCIEFNMSKEWEFFEWLRQSPDYSWLHVSGLMKTKMTEVQA